MSIFSQVARSKIQTNTFDLSHDRKMSMSMGKLTPIVCMEVLPNDKISLSTSHMMRFAPLIAPVMHQINVYTHYFFVPNRINWKNWDKFITGGEDGYDTSVFPTVKFSSTGAGTLSDYLGLPSGNIGQPQTTVSALPYNAYQLIFNEFYRDQNLVREQVTELEDGDNTGNPDLFQLNTRAWQHDYFTSALPWTQKGPEATIPLGGDAPVKFKEYDANDQRFTRLTKSDGHTPPIDGNLLANLGTGQMTAANFNPIEIDNSNSLYTDLSAATASSINDLRRAFKLQEWLEKNARGGSRYMESLMVHFGVKNQDYRLQRPEFLGGGRTPVTISEVLQTSETTDVNDTVQPQGGMAGHGISVGANNQIKLNATEHGYLIGIMSVLPRATYQQGIPKHFTKFDKFDYAWPSFANLGEQPIYNKELFFNNDNEDDEVFGYTPRYAEYKYLNSTVHGEFKTSLDFWHMGRIFENRPTLSAEFIQMQDENMNRIFAVQDQEHLYVHLYNRVKARRALPYFGTPKF